MPVVDDVSVCCVCCVGAVAGVVVGDIAAGDGVNAAAAAVVVVYSVLMCPLTGTDHTCTVVVVVVAGDVMLLVVPRLCNCCADTALYVSYCLYPFVYVSAHWYP